MMIGIEYDLLLWGVIMDVREAIYHASKILRRDFKDIKTKFAGYTPVYSFNTEDSASVFHHFRDYIKGQKVLTVTGSGDAILDLLLYGAKKIVSFDVNKSTIFYSKLKIAFIKSGLDKKCIQNTSWVWIVEIQF